ncbi:MAG: aminopeptidase P family protein [Bacilli bacterium]|nr:aminopeptidase P family protein [Bacilli bacterium]
MNKKFYINNRKALGKMMKDNSIAIIHSGILFASSADENYDFEVNRNFLYLTGINQEDVILMLVKGNNNVLEYLFLDENDEVYVKWNGAKLYPEEASKIGGFNEDDIYFTEEFKQLLHFILNPSRKNFNEIDTLYLDLERRTDLEYRNWVFQFKDRFLKDYPEIKIDNIYSKIVSLRQTKTSDEVEEIKKSVKTTKVGLEKVMENIKPGIYEYQAETYFDSYIKWDGNKPHSFKTICASGVNATILHYRDNNSLIKDGDLVLFDLGCHTNCYISDITRVYPANGKFNARQREVYNEVLNCNKKCIEFLKPGVTWKEYNDFANSLLIASMKKLGLIKKDKDFRKYYWHSIGHSIGLDTHDPSIYNRKFEEGMLTSVEPGIYIEEEGIGVRIEDDVLITKDGCINLSKDIIKEVDEIEAYMKENNIYLKK